MVNLFCISSEILKVNILYIKFQSYPNGESNQNTLKCYICQVNAIQIKIYIYKF